MNLKQLRERATRALEINVKRDPSDDEWYEETVDLGPATVLSLLDSIGEMADALKGYAELDKQPTYIGELVYTKSLGAEARNALEAHRRRFE